MPVGTLATVQAMLPRELETLGAQIVLNNAFQIKSGKLSCAAAAAQQAGSEQEPGERACGLGDGGPRKRAAGESEASLSRQNRALDSVVAQVIAPFSKMTL